MFHVGQKVVCVRDAWDIFPEELKGSNHPRPRRGVEYIVRSTYQDAFGDAIRLHWMPSPLLRDGFEPGYGVRGSDGVLNFRPVVERKTDTGFEVLEDIRKRESIPADERVRALVSQEEQGAP